MSFFQVGGGLFSECRIYLAFRHFGFGYDITVNKGELSLIVSKKKKYKEEFESTKWDALYLPFQKFLDAWLEKSEI